MAGTFEVYEDRAGKHRFRLKDSGGLIVAVGEAYNTVDDVKKACAQVQRAAGTAEAPAPIEEANQ